MSLGKVKDLHDTRAARIPLRVNVAEAFEGNHPGKGQF